MENKRIAELREQIERRQQTIKKYEALAAQFPGSDSVSKGSRKYYQGMARHASEKKAELEQELAGLNS